MTDKLLSKISFLLLLTLIAAACSKPTEPVQNVEAPIVSIPTTPAPVLSVPPFSLDSLSKEQRKAFEKAFPADARQAFENAKTISIHGSTMDNQPPILITSASDKRALLDSLYWDRAKINKPLGPNETYVLCKENGPTISSSESPADSVTIAISYSCGYFDLYWRKDSVLSRFSARDGLSRPLIRDLFRRENRPNSQLEMP